LEPPRKVEEEMKKKMENPNDFLSLNIGETWIVGKDRERSPFM